MNFLAHLLLGPHEAQQAVGSLLGDFVKGPMGSIELPRPVREGIWLHRQVDGFTDRHELVLRSKARISPQRRRYAGIMVDMFYDHLLARHWQKFSRQALDDFTEQMYQAVRAQQALLPERAKRVLLRMAQEDWLSSYAQLDSMHSALNNMSRRLRPGNTLVGSVYELEADYAGFEADFFEFMPQVVGFAKDSLRNKHTLQGEGLQGVLSS